MNAADLRWRDLCDTESRLRREVLELWSLKPEDKDFSENQIQPSADFKSRLRDWWAAVECLLKFAAQDGGRIVPADLLAALAGLAGHLAIGDIPSPISHAAVNGRHSMKPRERLDIGLAVAYIAAAKSGIEHFGEVILIADKSPIKTVQEAFGVPRQTVQRWVNTVAPCGLGSNPIDAEILESLMRQAGQRYRIAGRSVPALIARSKQAPRQPR